MKKLMLLCVAMAYCTCSFAQMWDNSKPDKNVTFGVRAGLNMNNLKGLNEPNTHFADEELNTDGLYCFHVGVNLDYNINKSFALETGVFFTNKGLAGYDYYLHNYNDEVRYSSNESRHRYFIQIPVLARFKFYVNEDFNIQIRAGGFAAPRIGANSDFGWFPLVVFTYKDFDAGLIGGLGISYKSIYLGAQYEYGLTEITRNYAGHTSNIAISLGYDF